MTQTRVQTVTEALLQEKIDLKERIAQQDEIITKLTESIEITHRLLDDIFVILQDTEQTQERALAFIREARDVLSEPDALAPQFDADFENDDEDGPSTFEKLRERIREELHQPLPFTVNDFKNGRLHYDIPKTEEDFPRAYYSNEKPSILESFQNLIAENPDLVSILMDTFSTLMPGKKFSSPQSQPTSDEQEQKQEELHDCGCMKKIEKTTIPDDDRDNLNYQLDSLIRIFSPDGFFNQFAQTVVEIIKKRPDLVPVALERAMSVIPALLATVEATKN